MSKTTPSAGWLKAESEAVRRPVGRAIAIESLGGGLLIAQAAVLAHVANAVIFAGAALAGVTAWLFAFLALIGLRAVLAYAGERARFEAAATIKTAIRDRLFRQIEGLGIVWQRRMASGDVVETLTDGVEKLEAYYGRYLSQTAIAVLLPVSILAVITPIEWLSGLILLTTAPLIPVFMIFIGKGAEKLNQRQWQRLGLLSGHFLDALQGLTTLRIFNLGAREARLIERLSDDYRRSTMAVLRIAFLSSLVLEFLATVSIALVAVLIGFRLMWGQLGFEAGFLVLLLAPEFYLPLRNMGSVYHARMEAIAAAERMVEIFDAPTLEWQGRRRDMFAATAPRLTLAGLTYTYPENDAPALAGIDLAIAPGETIAVVGASGAGKSTLALALLGLIKPDHGDLRIDDVPLADIAIDAWHEQLAWVPQQPRLFHASVRENLCLGDAAADDARLWAALERAQARDFVAALPQGLDTPIGERGQRLSGGQAQRLAIARAFVRDARFVVVDEISAHLDADNERRLITALATLARGRTMVLIAHRLASVVHADRIVVMDGGRIVEQGRHAQLLARGGVYARLAAGAEGRAA
ncbi:thiol reductant ABC exporter subunit CydD [Salinisphaera sp. T31B1]|uniref:thiol reductant ABC exporter subunit CydD n=1 Tax=Salinisphaera sp. T31B1 TaxID=727963 RepID=UPI00333E9E53